MAPGGFITHMTKERLRIRVPSRRRDNVFFNNIKEHVSKLDGVEIVDVNPLTSGILIIHRSNADSIMEYLRSQKLIEFKKELPSQTLLHKKITNGYSNLNNRVKTATSGAIDVSGIVFLTLAGLGIYQISKGNFAAPAWYTAFWYAMNIFLKGNKGTSDDLSE
ncbi:MAG: hypothetical protein N2596_01840 [Syntrophorhabdaceae bacterium]|nr:hypothetical protein [Syntrophorhabdaceae bacterium]